MAVAKRVEEALRRLRSESEAVFADLAVLPPADWKRPSNCPPWTIHVLVGHMLASIPMYLENIHEGLRGRLTPYASREERQQRIMQCAALEPPALLAELRAATDRFERDLGGLRPDQLELQAVHSHGPRPIHWFVDQRLAEVAFHHWDLHHSLGQPFDLNQETAAFLLPTLLEVNVPAIVGRDNAGGEGSFRLMLPGGPAWRLAFEPGSLTVTRDTQQPADATFEGDPSTLALLVFGRQTLPDLERAGRLRVSGRRDLANRFQELTSQP